MKQITHDVLQIRTEKPDNYHYIPGQATQVCIRKNLRGAEKGPFTFTSLGTDKNLEFIIKTYPEHEGITNEISELKPNNEINIDEAFGAIRYKEEGVFIAGGAGVTPFIAILRELHSKGKLRNNKLLFANKTKADIILEEELTKLLGKNFINILSEEKIEPYLFGEITPGFLKKHITPETSTVYLCGPPTMVSTVTNQLLKMGIRKDKIVTEQKPKTTE